MPSDKYAESSPNKFARCDVCGQLRWVTGGNLLTLTRPARFVTRRWPGRVYPAGTRYCWYHQIEEIACVPASTAERHGEAGDPL